MKMKRVLASVFFAFVCTAVSFTQDTDFTHAVTAGYNYSSGTVEFDGGGEFDYEINSFYADYLGVVNSNDLLLKGGFRFGSISFDDGSPDYDTICVELGAGYVFKNEEKMMLAAAAMFEYFTWNEKYSYTEDGEHINESYDIALYGIGADFLMNYYFTDHVGFSASAGFRYLLGKVEYSITDDSGNYSGDNDLSSLQPEISLGLVYKF